MAQRDGDVPEINQNPTAAYPTKSSLDAEAHHFAPPLQSTCLTLPQPEVPKFRGDLTEYMSFMNAFDSLVGSRVSANVDKLFY